jgi:hypothetical protein
VREQQLAPANLDAIRAREEDVLLRALRWRKRSQLPESLRH